jgi:hypothetical protein
VSLADHGSAVPQRRTPTPRALVETVPVADPVRERAKTGTPLHGELPQLHSIETALSV